MTRFKLTLVSTAGSNFAHRGDTASIVSKLDWSYHSSQGDALHTGLSATKENGGPKYFRIDEDIELPTSVETPQERYKHEIRYITPQGERKTYKGRYIKQEDALGLGLQLVASKTAEFFTVVEYKPSLWDRWQKETLSYVPVGGPGAFTDKFLVGWFYKTNAGNRGVSARVSFCMEGWKSSVDVVETTGSSRKGKVVETLSSMNMEALMTDGHVWFVKENTLNVFELEPNKERD